MTRVISVLAMLALVVFLIGCASVQKAKSFNDLSLTETGKTNVAHYNAANWGIYLLSIPLITGDTEKEFALSEKGVTLSSAFGKDTVNLESVAGMLTKAAKADGSTMAVDMQSSTSNVWFVPLLVIFIKTVEISANGVK